MVYDYLCLERVWKMLSANWDVQIAGMIFQTRSNVYPLLKQVKPKLTTAMKSTIIIGLALLSTGFLYRFLCNQRVTVPLWKD